MGITKIVLLIRLVFTSLIIFQTVSGQSLGVEPDLLLFPTINSVNNDREQDPDLFYEWDGDPRWLTGVNWGGSIFFGGIGSCLLYTSPSPRDGLLSRMPSSA